MGYDSKAPACGGYLKNWSENNSLCYMCGAEEECQEASLEYVLYKGELEIQSFQEMITHMKLVSEEKWQEITELAKIGSAVKRAVEEKFAWCSSCYSDRMEWIDEKDLNRLMEWYADYERDN